MSKITKKDLNERLLMVETLLGLHRALPEQISNDQANNAIFRMQCALSSGKEIAGRNPTEVEQRIEALEEFATYADNMLTELNHALPDPEYDAKREAQEADIDASLDRHRERLGLNKPQLKQLDQSIFDGLDEKWRFAAVDKCGEVWYSTHKTQPSVSGTHLSPEPNADSMQAEGCYDASNWQNSLIERKAELIGSDLCRAMLARGDEYVVCLVSKVADSHALKHREHTTLVEQWVERDGFYNYRSQDWGHAVPVNPATNEPLTAKEVGL